MTVAGIKVAQHFRVPGNNSAPIIARLDACPALPNVDWPQLNVLPAWYLCVKM